MNIRNKIIETFLDLVKIDSPSGYEYDVRNYVFERLRKVGINSEVDTAGNLFGKVEGIGKPVLLSAHLDTVEPGRNIKPVIIDDVIKSSGDTVLGADNKAAVAVILEILSSLNLKNSQALEFLFSVREEADGGINKFNFKKIKSKIGLTPDLAAPIGTIITASPWIVNLYINVKGRAVHSGYPEKGVNALLSSTASISKLKWGRIDKYTTANIGIFKSGTASNSIPGEVFLEGEVRSFSKKSLDKQLDTIIKVFKKVSRSNKTRVQIRLENYCAGYKLGTKNIAFRRLIATSKKLGLVPKNKISFGGSDANAFIQNGIDVINIGDGSKNPHELKESIRISDLGKLYKFIMTYITI